jgi:hypothetical protein
VRSAGRGRGRQEGALTAAAPRDPVRPPAPPEIWGGRGARTREPQCPGMVWGPFCAQLWRKSVVYENTAETRTRERQRSREKPEIKTGSCAHPKRDSLRRRQKEARSGDKLDLALIPAVISGECLTTSGPQLFYLYSRRGGQFSEFLNRGPSGNN